MNRLKKVSQQLNVSSQKENCFECGSNTPREVRQAGAKLELPHIHSPDGCCCAEKILNGVVGEETNASAAVAASSSSTGPPSMLWPPFNSKYDWKAVHNDLENGNYAGVYGWDNAAYWGISERKAGIDLTEWYKRRTEAEYYLPEFKELIDHPETQKEWDNIFMFDPLGFYAHPPTIAACKANLDIAELCEMPRDGKIIRKEDGQVRTQKAAIYYAWNMPRLAERLDMDEEDLRDALYKYSKNPELKDKGKNVYLPGVGGCTIYTFGDVRKIRDPQTEICVRVHDECIGSDVFGSDICTCRPYLIFALEQCIQCAQRGGVGIVIYYRKEGRSLGEVIKFRVYNARENQTGGDAAENYFHHTESIAGIRDARFQQMMPDALKWLGIKRIDWLCSMSNEKYEAIVGAGIRVMQRVTLPEDYVKENMKVEISAKVASGYNTETIDTDQVSLECMTLQHVRSQTKRLYEMGIKNQLEYFQINLEKIPNCVSFVDQVINDYYPNGAKIPPHSRMRHLEPYPQFEEMMKDMKCDKMEKVRRLLDLVFVSVLVDAGAGTRWKYMSDEKLYTSSEGLGIASLDMFVDGLFSSDKAMPYRVNSLALHNLTEKKLEKGFQVSSKNPLLALKGRLQLLQRLGVALENSPKYFGKEVPRPGNILDFVYRNGEVSLKDLWEACAFGLEPVWPKHASGLQTGDIWHHSKLTTPGKPGSDLVSFHKLTQWLLYSVIEVIETGLGITVKSDGLSLTALAEYRNGGLLVDMGILTLRDPQLYAALHSPGSELIVEWRALTIQLMDTIAAELAKKYPGMQLAQVLEGGTWRAGRVIAKKLRADGSPPIKIRSDGTVF